jgi:glycosyltransferase involved in cell wall biosynthesis
MFRSPEKGRKILVVGAYAPSLINFRGPLIRALAAAAHEVTAMAAEAPPTVVESLRAMGACYRRYGVRRGGMNPVVEIRTLLALRRVIKEVEPHVVLAYTVKPIVWTGIALRAFPSPRFVAMIEGVGYAFHGTSWRRRAIRLLVSALYRRALERAYRVVFLNPDNLREFVSRGIVDPAKCELVNGAGVDTQTFTPVPLPRGPVSFLTIARLLGEKGIREYAEAARLVRKRYPESVFRLIGPEDESPDRIPFAEVRRWHEEGVLEYGGVADDVRPDIAACHVYVLASYHEGLPRTVLEAMAMGRPILTTDAPGCRETVVPGQTGFLVPVRDVDALVDRMTWFVENRSEIERMGQRGRAMAVERFDTRLINERLMRIMAVTA